LWDREGDIETQSWFFLKRLFLPKKGRKKKDIERWWILLGSGIKKKIYVIPLNKM